jgi:hypothetical protein
MQSEAFFEVGGYNPLITGTEDLDLCRRLAYAGDFANTPAPVACLSRGESWSTSTDYGRAPADTLTSRDQVLAEPNALARLSQSADSAYWYGRLVRVYISTAKWTWQQKRTTTALSRLLYALLCTLKPGPHLFSPQFGHGLKDHHVPESLHFIVKALEEKRP